MPKPASVKIPLIGWELLLLAVLVLIVYLPNVVPISEDLAGRLFGSGYTPTLQLEINPSAGIMTQQFTTLRGSATLTSSSTYAKPIYFTATGLPNGVTITFSPTSCILKSTRTCSFNFVLTATPQAATGNYTIRITAGDNATSVSRPFLLTIDKTLQLMTLNLTVNPTSGTITQQTNTIRGTVSAVVTSRSTGTIYFSATSPSGITVTFPTQPSCNLHYQRAPKCSTMFTINASPQVASGTYTITFSAGGTNTPVASKTFTLIVDRTPPTVGATHVINWTSATITATASDSNGLSNVLIYVDNVLKKSCTNPPSPCVSSANYAAGSTHTYYATARDTYGNSGRDPASGTKTFTVKALSGDSIKALEGFYGGVVIYGPFSGSGCTILFPEFGGPLYGQGIDNPPAQFYVMDPYSFLNTWTPDGYVGEAEEARLRSLSGMNLLNALTVPRTFHGWMLYAKGSESDGKFIGIGWPILQCTDGERLLSLRENLAYISPADSFVDKSLIAPPEPPGTMPGTSYAMPSTGIATVSATGNTVLYAPFETILFGEVKTQCETMKELCAENETGKTYALLIMGSREQWPDAAGNNYTRFKPDMDNMSMFVNELNVPSANIIKIGVDREISVQDVENAIATLAASAQPCDNVLIYYVDHGSPGIVGVGLDKKKDLYYAQLAGFIRNFKSDIKITIIIDACYSGSAIPILSDETIGRPDIQIMTAAPQDNVAWDGIFTSPLLKGARNTLANDDECKSGNWFKNWYQCWAKAYPYAMEYAMIRTTTSSTMHYPMCILPFKTSVAAYEWLWGRAIDRVTTEGAITTDDAEAYKTTFLDAAGMLKTNWAGRQEAYNKLLDADKQLEERLVTKFNMSESKDRAKYFKKMKKLMIKASNPDPTICIYASTIETNTEYQCSTKDSNDQCTYLVSFLPMGFYDELNDFMKCESKGYTWVRMGNSGICDFIGECRMNINAVKILIFKDVLDKVAQTSVDGWMDTLRSISSGTVAADMYDGLMTLDKSVAEELLKANISKDVISDTFYKLARLKTRLLQEKAPPETCIVYEKVIDANENACYTTAASDSLSLCRDVLGKPKEPMSCEKKKSWWIPPAAPRDWGVCDSIYECKALPQEVGMFPIDTGTQLPSYVFPWSGDVDVWGTITPWSVDVDAWTGAINFPVAG